MSSKLLLPRCGVFRPQFQLAEVLPTKHVHMRMRQVSADWVIEDEPEKRLEQSKAFCNAGIHKQTGNINKGDFEVTFQAERPSDLDMFCFLFQAQSSGIQTAEFPKNFCTFCFQG